MYMDAGVWHLEEDLKHVRTLLPHSRVHCALPVVVAAVWVGTTLQKHADHLCDDNGGGGYV